MKKNSIQMKTLNEIACNWNWIELKKDEIQIITKKYWKFVYTYDVEKKKAVKTRIPKDAFSSLFRLDKL